MALDEYTLTSRGLGGLFARYGLGQRLAALIMPQLQRGHLRLIMPSGELIERRGEGPGTGATIMFRRWRGVLRVLRDGEIGLAQAWIDDDWSTPDLDAIFAFGLENIEPVEKTNRGWRLSEIINRFSHRGNANTRRGSRRNIAAHYDIGNAFYAHWLDRGMNYSSALYRGNHETFEDAQEAKLERAAELLDLQGGEHILEIGCGWGAMAEYMTRHHGCKVTGLTLSEEQLAYARSRLVGYPEGAAEIRLQDYRDVEGTFDRIVSIEMVEAVGERYWPVYFAKLRSLLKSQGHAVLQAITISDERFETYRSKPDFIQRYIFPGGMLPTARIIREHAARAGLCLTAQESFGPSYARTLSEWRDRFLAAWPQIEALGFDARFKRMWLYYLAYCEAGFRAGAIDVGFYKLTPSEG